MKVFNKLMWFLTFCLLISFQVKAENSQEKTIQDLLSVRNMNVSEVLDVCSPDIYTNEHFEEKGLSFSLITGETKHFKNMFIDDVLVQFNAKAKNIEKFETRAVSIQQINGYTFHIADYYGSFGHSRVVTSLDGEVRGVQLIADNGVLMAQSTDVKWHNNYFVHKYPHAKVSSYSNKQIIEIK